jgi:hypothetical protein
MNGDYGTEANIAVISILGEYFHFRRYECITTEFTIGQAGAAIASLLSLINPGMFTTSSDFVHKIRNLIREIHQFFQIFSQQSSQDMPLRGLIKASCFAFSDSPTP